PDWWFEGVEATGFGRLNRDQATFGRGQCGDLLERGGRAVIIHLDLIQQGNGRTAGPQPREFMPQVFELPLHFLGGLFFQCFPHGSPVVGGYAWPTSSRTNVPRCSPCTTRLMLPFSFTLNTMIGRL